MQCRSANHACKKLIVMNKLLVIKWTEVEKLLAFHYSKITIITLQHPTPTGGFVEYIEKVT